VAREKDRAKAAAKTKKGKTRGRKHSADEVFKAEDTNQKVETIEGRDGAGI
jgi:hypothetical protein